MTTRSCERPHSSPELRSGLRIDAPCLLDKFRRLAHRRLSSQVDNQIGRTTLEKLLECLRGCTVLLTNDTGTMHLAAMLGVRVVAIFGSTEPRLTGPLGVGHTVLQHRVPCGPCFQRECHLDFACMKGVSALEVAQALAAALSAERNG